MKAVVALVAVAILASISTATAATIKGNPDQLPSLTIFGGMASSEGDWQPTSGDPSQGVESESSAFGIQFRYPVSTNITIYATGSKSTGTSKSVESVYYYGSETDRSGWTLGGGITIYFGATE